MTLWLSTENQYVPIGSRLVHMCIAYDGETYAWLNELGSFRASMNDEYPANFYDDELEVIPRKCK